MKKYLIHILLLLSVASYAQTAIDPATSPTTARINNAIGDAVTASGTNTYSGTYVGLVNVSNRGYAITFTNGNTGASTFNLNTSGAVTLKKFSSGSLVDLVSGDIANGETKKVRFNGTYLVIEGGTGSGGGGLLAANNLSDLVNAATARTNLGLGTLATQNGTAPSSTIVGISDTQTLTNKTLTSPVLTTPDLGTPSNLNLSNANSLNLTTGIVGILPVANGGTGTATPGLVAGTNITSITGTWPNQTINASGGGGGSGTVTSVTSADGNATVATTTTTPVITIVSAPKLQTARNINGTSFDGTANITIPAANISLGTLTADPVNLPASSNTIDVFANRSLGNFQNIYSTYTLPTVTGLNNKFVVDGNSQGDGAALADPTQRYGNLVNTILGSTGAGYTYSNFAVAGQTTQQMNADAVSQIDAAYDGSKTKNFLAAFEVENDAAINTGQTTAQLYTSISNYYSGRKAAGYYVIGMTSPLRSYYTASAQDLTINQRIATVNASIRAGTSDYNTLIDIPALPRTSNQKSRIGFLNDNLHLNYSGHMDLADQVVSKIRTNLGQTDYTPKNFASWNGNTPDRSMIFGSLNSQPVGFITNGKVRGEFETYGTLNINPDVTANNDILFNSRNQAIGMFINPGLTTSGNSDILSAFTIQPEYFDNTGAFTGVLTDNFQINKPLTLTTHASLLRVDKDGRFISNPTFISAVADIARQWGGTITGPASGSFTGDIFGQTVNIAANNTTIVGANIANTVNRGAFTGTIYKAAVINSGSTATSSDMALDISAVAGTGINMSNHAGTGSGINISSSSTGSALAAGMSSSAGIPIVAYKTTGSAVVGRFINQGTTNASGLLDIMGYERTGGTQVAGSGASQYWIMNSTTPNNRRAFQNDVIWISNTDAAEKSAMVWKNMISGTLAERMRLEGDKLSIGFGATPTALLHIKPSPGNAGTAPMKMSYNNITTTAASGTGTVATIQFATQPAIPFEAGGLVTISGVTPSGYNGTYTVTSATTIAVSYANATTGVQTVAGKAKTTLLATPEDGAVEIDEFGYYETNSTAVRGTRSVIRTNVTSAGTLTLSPGYSHYIFSGTTTTWTLPLVSGTTNVQYVIKNRGSGSITLNTTSGNEIYDTSAVNTLTIAAGTSATIVSDGTFYNKL